MRASFIYFLFFWPHHVACGVLVPQPGIEIVLPILKAESLENWTTKEVPVGFMYKKQSKNNLLMK